MKRLRGLHSSIIKGSSVELSAGKGGKGRMVVSIPGPFHLSRFSVSLLFGMTFRADGRARCLTCFFQIPVAILAGVVKGRFCGNLGFLGVAIRAFLYLLAFLPCVVALVAVLDRIGMRFMREWSPLVFIRCVKPGIVDGYRVRLPEDALQDEQGTKEQHCGNNGNEFLVHQTLTSFLLAPFFTKTG